VVDIDDRKIIFDKGEIVRNGAALHIDHGIAVTSHASQVKTVDQALSGCRFGHSTRQTNMCSRNQEDALIAGSCETIAT
jgi:hypothetical protein